MIDIIAVTYNHNENLKCFINSIKSQTDSRWKLFIIHDGPAEFLRNNLKNNGYLTNNIFFIEHPFRTKKYGHILRKWGLENLVSSKYVILTNGDNYYTPNTVSEILKRQEDFVYFDCIHSHNSQNNNNSSNYGYMDCQLKRGFIDIGCVAIDSSIAKKIGFNHTNFAADWFFFRDILKTNPSIFKIKKVLLVHN